MAVFVAAIKRREDRFPFDKPLNDQVFSTCTALAFRHGERHGIPHRSEGLQVSLYTPFKNLPPEGRVRLCLLIKSHHSYMGETDFE